MSIFLRSLFRKVLTVTLVSACCTMVSAQKTQVDNSNFEDWSAAAFDGNPQAQNWNASNVEQVGLKFNFAHRETGRGGGYCFMVQDQDVGAMGITETSPGYVSLGKPWAYVPSITAISQATAGTAGGISWTARPDTMSVWIKRTGSNTDKEDYYLLFYAWNGQTRGDKYKAKNGNCTSVTYNDEESDVRQAVNGNECGTSVKATQVCEGYWRARNQFSEWTNIRVPIYYFNNTTPTTMNIIFSASNYPNFRANDGLYTGNSLYIDDLELIYSSKIHKLFIDEKEWKGFDPNSSDVQVYALGESATSIPKIEAMRGAGSITNTKGTTVNLPGRTLSGSEITITNGDLSSKPTVITVKSEDGKSTTTYKIQFTKAASSNAKLASISVNGTPISGFNPTKYNYTVGLPYGTTAVPVVSAEGQEEKQAIAITQPTSITGTSTIVVTAPNGTNKATYTLSFTEAALADNTLKDIQVNGKSVPGFSPSQTTYKVSLPVGTASLDIKPVSAYKSGEQTIVITPSTLPTGQAIDGSSVQISVTTPGNQVAKVYKLNFKLEASSYSYLQDLQVVGDQVLRVNPAKSTDSTALAFTPENMTYYITLKMGTTELPEILYSRGDEYQAEPKIELGGLDGTTRVIVTAGNKVNQSIYKLVFSTEKSEISTLQGIKIGGVALADFRPDVTSYEYPLPIGTTELPTIEPIAHDEFQNISVVTGGLNGTTRITVTAGNGNTTIYLITFSVDSYTNNTLADLSVKGCTLLDSKGNAVAFDSQTNEYWVNLPQGTTTLPEVTYTPQTTDEALQKINVREGGINGDYRITVRPQSGQSRTYIIHFSVATSSNTALQMIKLDGKDLEGFAPDSLHYTVILPEGVSTIPTVTYVKGEASQRVLSVLEDTTQILTVTAESGAKREYRVDFRIQLSANAFLEMIYLDGVELAGFDPEKTNYTVQLTSEVCPEVTVAKKPGQQVSIATPVGAGVAVILVAPERGATQRYTITFQPVAMATIHLQDILIDGVSLASFQPTKTHYELTYTGELPQVTYQADASLTVNLLWDKQTAYLHVSDAAGTTLVYDIVFTQVLKANVLLASIKADGVQLADFAPEKKHYTYPLAAGSAYPVLSYERGDASQSVVTGQTDKGEWSFFVTAENGDTTVYQVRYTIAPYTETTLENIELVGLPSTQTFSFAPTTFNYSGLTLDEGAALPDLRVTARPKQTVMSYNQSDTKQIVLVTAENGDQATYTIVYTRKMSNNALLSDIRIDSLSIPGFSATTFAYTYPLPQGATVVPNIFPVGQLDNQTITTEICRPNGTTKIHVVAQDGTKADYSIAFPVAKCTNTKLGRLLIDGINRSVDTTDYEFELPFGSTEPYEVDYEKAEAEQMIEFIQAPINGVTKIIVTDENGDKRTYSIRYTVKQPQGENIIKKVVYEYVTAASATKQDSIVPVAGNNVIELPYGAKSFSVTRVDKNYPEQSVLFYNGGIRRGATIVASANRDGAEDATYTLTPHMPDFDTKGKLKELKFKNKLIPNFRPDVYNYVISVTSQPTAANFTATAYDGKSVSRSIDTKKKQITLTVSSGEKYSVCWYYTNCEPPFVFDWVQTEKAHYYKKSFSIVDYTSVEDDGERDPTGYKPKGWSVPADLLAGVTYDAVVSQFTYNSGKEVTRMGDREVMLSTIRGGALNSSLPGAMTLGSLNLPDGVKLNGKTKVSFDKDANSGVTFKNSPEQFQFEYMPISSYGISKWNAWMAISDGGTTNVKEYTISGDYSNQGVWQTKTTDLNYNFAIQKFNVLLCSSEVSGTSLSIYDGDEAKSSDLQIRNLRFVYNSELTAATVDGATTTKSGTTFTKTVSEDYVGVPALKFTGKVHDQMQTVEWLNNGEWLNGELKAKVVNYGENAKDSTVYTVVLKRSAITSLDYEIAFGSYPTETSGDTTIIALPFGIKALPDIQITPASIHQQFAIAKSGNAVKVTVSAENGSSKTNVYVFRETKSSEATVAGITAEDALGNPVPLSPGFDADEPTYAITAAQMPTISFEKLDGVAGQTFDLNYTANTVTLTVTAADGSDQRTYTITRNAPAVVTSGRISEFYDGKNLITDFGGTSYSCEKERPANIVFFERVDASDSVVFVQQEHSMEWRVYGSENHTYTYSYPASASNNAELATIRLNGQAYSEFNPGIDSYTIYADSVTSLVACPAEQTQTLAIADEAGEDGVLYTITVTAEDAVAKKVYKVRVKAAQSNDNRLASIAVDGVEIAGFHADTLDYTITLPTPSVKTVQPQMPSISYTAGQSGQQIELTQGSFGATDPTLIRVTSENGESREYSVTVVAEPSHNAELTGIMVNGAAMEGFEPGRHFYSVEINTEEVEIVATAEDRFQMVDTTRQGTTYIIHVTAEDGVTTSEYQVNVYVQAKSNDATLSNILLDGNDFALYRPELNPLLAFDPMQNSYNIHLPSGATSLPEVTAQLKMEGQEVAISKNGMKITVTVTAVDGSTNTYNLLFDTPKSKDANLSMIFLNGDSLPNFKADDYFYQVDLPIGVHTMPEVAGQKGEAHQTILPVEIDAERLRATIRVVPEDTTANASTYVVAFHFTQSGADTLKMIYADGDSLLHFSPNVFFYSDSLAVGTMAFPELSWEEADEWQQIALDTAYSDASNLVRQIFVVAENGKSNTYTVSYTIRKSAVDTLQAIFIDTKALEGFDAQKEEYSYLLTAAQANELNGELPKVEYIAGDEHQNVLVSQAPDTLIGKSLKMKSLITVTAATGAMRTYTIHYPVERSSEANLNMIMLGGKPLSGFDAERYMYRLEIEGRNNLPVVSVVKKEEVQTYEIFVNNDTITIDVTAEDGTKQLYTLAFERLLSSNTRLNNIIVKGHSEFHFNPEELDYTIVLPYGEDSIPQIEVVLGDTLQTVPEEFTRVELENGDIQVVITVKAANGEDEGVYTLTFHFTKNNDARLTAIYVGENLLEGFSSETTEYDYYHPYGTTPEQMLSEADIRVELSDTLAVASITMAEDRTISIQVVAQDGETEMTYIIRQNISPDSDNWLSAILLDGDTIRDFQPDVTFYTHYLPAGATTTPLVEAITRSENAEADIRQVSAGDTCTILCTAQNGAVRKYYVYFAISQIDDAKEATSNDVLLKRLPGTVSMLVATIRKDVSIALYDQDGHLVFYGKVPVADPNDVQVTDDPNTLERLNDVANPSSGLVIPLIPGQIYQYSFFLGDKQKLKSGKFIALP